MSAAAGLWRHGRADRRDLAAWLAAAVSASRNEFLERCFRVLLETGSFSEAQESPSAAPASAPNWPQPAQTRRRTP